MSLGILCCFFSSACRDSLAFEEQTSVFLARRLEESERDNLYLTRLLATFERATTQHSDSIEEVRM